MTVEVAPALAERCERLRSLHVSGRPLLLPNAWDAASAQAVAAAGFPVVATTSGGIAASLGHADHEQAPAGEMLAAAERIVRSLDVPVTVDAEAGYGMEPDALVEALAGIGAAGCNLEDSDHAHGRLRDVAWQADWLAAVRAAAGERDYPLVINARVDVFLADREAAQAGLVGDALARARAYLAAGVDCVFPIFLSDEGAIGTFVRELDAPVNILALPQAPPLERLAALGVARISHGSSLHRRTIDRFEVLLAELTGRASRSSSA